MEIAVSSVSVVLTDLDVGLTSTSPWETDDACQQFDDEGSLSFSISQQQTPVESPACSSVFWAYKCK